MSRKGISLSQKAYDRLQAEKRDDESFNDVVLRLCDDSETDKSHDDTSDQTPARCAATNVDEIARAVGDEVENRLARR
jgi:phosphopantothenoylcysteine synthetase/decarboxylase